MSRGCPRSTRSASLIRWIAYAAIAFHGGVPTDATSSGAEHEGSCAGHLHGRGGTEHGHARPAGPAQPRDRGAHAITCGFLTSLRTGRSERARAPTCPPHHGARRAAGPLRSPPAGRISMAWPTSRRRDRRAVPLRCGRLARAPRWRPRNSCCGGPSRIPSSTEHSPGPRTPRGSCSCARGEPSPRSQRDHERTLALQPVRAAGYSPSYSRWRSTATVWAAVSGSIPSALQRISRVRSSARPSATSSARSLTRRS